MDWVAFREKLRALPRKYPYMILSVLAGILLMTWPQPKQKPVDSRTGKTIPQSFPHRRILRRQRQTEN